MEKPADFNTDNQDISNYFSDFVNLYDDPERTTLDPAFVMARVTPWLGTEKYVMYHGIYGEGISESQWDTLVSQGFKPESFLEINWYFSVSLAQLNCGRKIALVANGEGGIGLTIMMAAEDYSYFAALKGMEKLKDD